MSHFLTNDKLLIEFVLKNLLRLSIVVAKVALKTVSANVDFAIVH